MKITALSLLLLATGTVAGGDASPRPELNPALLYYRASQLAPEFSPAEREELFTKDWQGRKLPAHFGELLARYDNQFALVRQAAGATGPCDWGIDMSLGPATLLPHLARNKAVAQAVRLRARWFLEQGRAAEATEDLAATLALARNTSRDGTMIAALVQIAMEFTLCNTVAENFHRFPPATLKPLAHGFEAAPPRGTMAACVATEKALFSDWLLGRILAARKAHPADEAKVMAAIGELLPGLEAAEEAPTRPAQARLSARVAKAAGGSSEAVIKLLRETEAPFQRVEAIMALPPREYEDQMKQFSAELQKSPNPFLPDVVTPWGKCRPKEFAVLAQLAMVRAGIQYKLEGAPGLQRVSDPAGEGPFTLERFVFAGVDRGFLLRSACRGRGFPEVLIFIEKDGPPFQVSGKNAGQPVSK